MGSSTIPAANAAASDNWLLVSTATMSGAQTLAFTSISGYAKLKVVYSGDFAFNLSACRINNDNTNKYAFVGQTATGSIGQSSLSNTAITSTTYQTFIWTILSCDNSNLKTYSISAYGSGAGSADVTGIYQATASVTSLNFTWDTAPTGTVRLYGVAA